MKRIIKIWEQFLVLIMFASYYMLVSLYMIKQRTYKIDESLKIYQNKAMIFIYGGVIFIYLILLFREVLLKRRINFDDVIVKYSPERKICYIRIALVILINLMFWILYCKGLTNIIVMYVIIFSPFLLPRPIYNSIFESEKYIIYGNNKYYFFDITNVKESSFYSVELKVKQKELTIYCFSEKKYDILCEIFHKQQV